MSSSAADVNGVLQDFTFEPVGTIHFDGEETPRYTPRHGSPAPRRGRLKLFALCSGQVRLMVHEPLVASGPGNPYRQVSLTTVEIFGHEDANASSISGRSARGLVPALGAASLSDCGDEVARVLTELGIPLDIVPVDEDAVLGRTVDAGTRRLLEELQRRRLEQLEALKFGDAQELSEHIQHLGTLGAELKALKERCDRYAGAGELAEAKTLAERVKQLEEQRLSIAALYETDFWLEQMVLPQGDTGGRVS